LIPVAAIVVWGIKRRRKSRRFQGTDDRIWRRTFRKFFLQGTLRRLFVVSEFFSKWFLGSGFGLSDMDWFHWIGSG